MAPRVSFDERVAVEDANDVSVDPDSNELAGEEPRDSVPRTGEDDPAVAVDLSQVAIRSQMAVGRRRRRGVLGSLDGVLDHRLGRLHDPEPEPLGRGPLAEGLVRSERVVVLDEGVQGLLGLLDRRERVL